MNPRNIKFTGALLLGILLSISLNAQSPRQGGWGQGSRGDGPMHGHRYASLDLSEEQQEELTALRTAHYKAVTPMKNKMGELKARERTLLSEESVDMKALNNIIDEQTELMNSIRKLQVEHQVAVKGLLSDEQLMNLQQHREFTRRNGFHGSKGYRGTRDGRASEGMHTGRAYRRM